MRDYRDLIRNECMEKEDAFCMSACPFHLDVREFVSRAQRGGFNAAFRTFANAVCFPAIVSELCDEPCKAVCPRRETDAAISLREIERAALAYASNTKPNSYNLPAKHQKIAIVGGGISGLACALRLANRKYAVSVYEKSGRLGGHLWGALDPQVFISDIEQQFMHEEYELFLHREITSLDELADFDAVYVATGAGGGDFGLRDGANVDGVPFASSVPGVFLGGSLMGASSMEAIYQGTRAATVIEFYFKTGNMKSAEAYVPTKIEFDRASILPSEPVTPADGAMYAKEEAAAEAARCLRCRCNACVRHCELMTYFQKPPKRIEEEVEATVHPGTIDGNGTVAMRFISTCNQCGLCAEVCPIDIDMGLFLRASHQYLRKKSEYSMPWAFHEFWLRDMAFANGPRAALTSAPPGGAACEYIFYPGCQLGASDPRYVTESYRFLLAAKPGTALGLRCCGAPAVWAGDEALFGEVRAAVVADWQALGKPRAIFACPTCADMFAQFMPEIYEHAAGLLYDVMCNCEIVAKRKGSGEASVFDPCASRHKPDSQANVRKIVERAGYELVSLPYEGSVARCCTFGGQIDITNPTYTKWLVNERVTAGEAPYVAYCSNCRDIFADAGKKVVHVLDILFDLNDFDKKPPTVNERRRNRERLREEVAKMFGAESGPKPERPRLAMDTETEKKINADRLLAEDIFAVIERCEASGRKVVDAENGHFTGYGEMGHATLWVEYAPEGDGYRLFNAYSHRMKIELEDVWHGAGR